MERKLSKRNIVGIVFTGVTSLLMFLFAFLLFLIGRPLQGGLGRVVANLMLSSLAVPVIALSLVSICLSANCKPFKLLPLASLGVLILSAGASIGGYRYFYVREERFIEVFADYTSVVNNINSSVYPTVTCAGIEGGSFVDRDHNFYNFVKDIEVDVAQNRPLLLPTRDKVEYASLEGCSITYYERNYVEVRRKRKGTTYMQGYYLRYASFGSIYVAATGE